MTQDAIYGTISQTLLCLKCVSQLLHDQPKKTSPPATSEKAQKEVYRVLSLTKRFAEEHLLQSKTSVADHDATVLEPFDELLTTLLPSDVLLSLKEKYCFPVGVKNREATYPPSPGLDSKILASIDPTVSINSLEQTVLDQEIRRILNIPLGHTEFSWLGGGTLTTTPLGHTPYSYPLDGDLDHPLICLREIVRDVRAFERTKTFHKFLLRGIIAQKRDENGEGDGYSKENYSYGTTPYQSYTKLAENVEYRAAVEATKSSGGRAVVLGSR
jgi:hypothetical protein